MFVQVKNPSSENANIKSQVSHFSRLPQARYIYKHFLNTKILSPKDLHNSIMKITADEIKSIINEVFNFNKCIIVYSNKEKPLKSLIKLTLTE